MATGSIDTLTVIEAQERHGALRRLVREAIVTGITATDWSALTQALTAAGIPEYGAELTGVASDNAYDLTLVERAPSLIDESTYRVRLVYEN